MRFTPMQHRHDPTTRTYRPNWPGDREFVNDEHAGIYEATKDLPGWQDPGDSMKLYEAAYWSGSVILEIGVFGGRSAAVQLKGALAALREHGGPPPQFYGIDQDFSAFRRSTRTLEGMDLAERVMLYTGDLRQFAHDLPIVPTMVFVDGSHDYTGVWADLEALSRLVTPGTPVMCHDYANADTGVPKAVDDWVQRGAFELWGVSQNTAVLRATDLCRGSGPRGLSEAMFRTTADALHARYAERTEPGPRQDVADLTHAAREELGVAVGQRLGSPLGPSVASQRPAER